MMSCDLMFVFFRRDTGEWESPKDMPSQNNPMFLKNTFERKSNNCGDLGHFESLTVLIDHTWSPYLTNSIITTPPKFEVTSLPPEKNDCLEDPFNFSFLRCNLVDFFQGSA